MTRLYSYCLPFDDGAAPNPFWGTCTLVICKPAIRRTAKVGDWIAGTGAQKAYVDRRTAKDFRGKLVYAMKVTQKMTMEDYDGYAQTTLPAKVPDWNHDDRRRRLGDAIYDYSGASVVQRPGVHGDGNIATDLSGKFALLSDHFYYFGANAIDLPGHLSGIAQNQEGHRAPLNDPYVDAFTKWIASQPRGLNGEPLMNLFGDDETPSWCAGCRKQVDENDVESDAQTTSASCK